MKLEEIKDPKFLKDLSINQLNDLAFQIRQEIIKTVSRCGGHLSSNLGTVELEIALHKVFDFTKDRLYFDVAHQTYTHKLLTGRYNQFQNLRNIDGTSGFLSPNESEYDHYFAGHSGTSIPTAIGAALSRDNNKQEHDVISFIGDAAITSGISLGSLNTLGGLNTKMIIILNDNKMSISKNVGALKKVFLKLRSSNKYSKLKNKTKRLLYKITKSDKAYIYLSNIRDYLKYKIINPGIFKDFNINYLGPIDGHDIVSLINCLKLAKNSKKSIIIHCITEKGKGYEFSENDQNGKWHGVSSFDLNTGNPLKKTSYNTISYSSLVSNKIEELMHQDQSMIAITPAMIGGSSLANIQSSFPNRLIDCGINEDQAMNIASGIALNKTKVFISVYSTFLQRCYDQLNHDISRMKLPIILGIDRAGIVGEDGSGHNGTYDISLLRNLPNFVIVQGRNYNEILNLLDFGYSLNVPFAIRYPRGELEVSEYKKYDIKLGTWVYLSNNNYDMAIISYGEDVETINKYVIENNLKIDVVDARFIKPIDEILLKDLLLTKKQIFVYTTDVIKGGLVDSILEYQNQLGSNCKIKYPNDVDCFIKHGKLNDVKKYYKLDIETFMENIEKELSVK